MTVTEPWALRDVRRTVETQMRELRTPSDVVAAILNHNTSHLRKIYDKSENLSEKRKALLRYERYLQKLKTKGELRMMTKPLVWLHGEVKTPPFSQEARLRAGFLLRELQDGENSSMPD